MNNILNNSKNFVPPGFMVTTRQKILFKEQKLPHSFFEIEHPKTMHILNYLSDVTKEMINTAKR